MLFMSKNFIMVCISLQKYAKRMQNRLINLKHDVFYSSRDLISEFSIFLIIYLFADSDNVLYLLYFCIGCTWLCYGNVKFMLICIHKVWLSTNGCYCCRCLFKIRAPQTMSSLIFIINLQVDYFYYVLVFSFWKIILTKPVSLRR